jgi:serine/threonine-protein kinase
VGVIYRARQISLNRLVALKMLRDSRLASPQSIQRLQIEAEAAAKLHHPNIVPIYEFGECAGQRFISMKLVEGTDLGPTFVP